MEDNDKREFHYLIPANVSARFEFIEGFGFKELIIVVTAFLISLVFYAILSIPKELAYVNALGNPIENVTKEMLMNGSAIEREINKVPMIWRILTVLVPTSLTFALVKKDSTGISPIESIRKFKKFRKTQKKYSYIYNSGSEV